MMRASPSTHPSVSPPPSARSLRRFARGVALALALAGCQGRSEAPAPEGASPSDPSARAAGAATAAPVAAPAAAIPDWCGGHGVPESVCTRCNPSLIPQFQAKNDWCAEHGLPESQCTICHPELIEKFGKMAPAGAAEHAPAHAPGAPPAGAGEVAPAAAAAPADWCGGHGLPESVCTRCNPALIPQFKARNDWCAEHSLPESQCTICHPELIEKFRQMAPKPAVTGQLDEVPRPRPYEGVKVRLASPETAAKAGIATAPVRVSSVEQEVSAPVRLVFDETRTARVASPVPGQVREVKVVAGAAVRAGQPLVVIASPALAEAAARLRESEAALVVAERTLEREQRLVARDVSPKKDLIEARRAHEAAQAAVAGARGVLAAIGGSPAAGASASQLTLRAPRSGVVTDLHVVVGQTAEPDQVLAQITDPTHLWADLDLAEADAARVRPGAAVRLAFDALPEREVLGSITWLASQVDPRTRTVHARAEVGNDEAWLRAGMFGRARIGLGSRPALLVPGDAVQDGPEGPVAFVQLDPQVYEPRALKLGRASEHDVEVMAGLEPGERVVTRGSFLLKTEIMKGSLGAGCCDAVEK